MKVPLRPPPWDDMIARLGPDALVEAVPSDPAYLHWDDVFHRSTDAKARDRWWVALKVGRLFNRRQVPLTSVGGEPFWFTRPDTLDEMLHRVDQKAVAQVSADDPIVNLAMREKYVMSSLMEEAIASSQLEGASTSRRVAKEMLRTGRKPKDRSEQMVLNNFNAMQFVRDIQDKSLTPELVAEIQRIVTHGTLDDEADAGRVQQPGDVRVSVCDEVGQVLHAPPPATDLPERLAAMCDFANGGGEGWIHPVLRAAIVHFWLGYDHPFADGNGRTARVLFHWSMLRQGYRLAEFVAISPILRKAHGKYARSFLLTETDDNDLTYFLLYQVDVLLRAIDVLIEYVGRKARETREVERLMKSAWRFNHRQFDLLSHALRHPDASYTIASHRRSHDVVYQTARTDLLELVDAGLLALHQAGKTYVFTPAPDLAHVLQDV